MLVNNLNFKKIIKHCFVFAILFFFLIGYFSFSENVNAQTPLIFDTFEQYELGFIGNQGDWIDRTVNLSIVSNPTFLGIQSVGTTTSISSEMQRNTSSNPNGYISFWLILDNFGPFSTSIMTILPTGTGGGHTFQARASSSPDTWFLANSGGIIITENSCPKGAWCFVEWQWETISSVTSYRLKLNNENWSEWQNTGGNFPVNDPIFRIGNTRTGYFDEFGTSWEFGQNRPRFISIQPTNNELIEIDTVDFKFDIFNNSSNPEQYVDGLTLRLQRPDGGFDIVFQSFVDFGDNVEIQFASTTLPAIGTYGMTSTLTKFNTETFLDEVIVSDFRYFHFQEDTGQGYGFDPNIDGCDSPTGIVEIFSCKISEILQWLFIPGQNSLNQFSNLKNTLSEKIPFGYFILIRNNLKNISELEVASIEDVEIENPLFGTIVFFDWSELKTFLSDNFSVAFPYFVFLAWGSFLVYIVYRYQSLNF